MAEAQECRVKGHSLLTLFPAIRELKGAEVEQAVRDGLESELRQAIQFGGVISSGWYPVGWYRDVHATLQRVTGDGVGLAFQVGRTLARRDATGIYKLLFKVLSPATLFDQSSRILKVYLDPIHVEVIAKRPTYGHVKVSKCRGFDRNLWHDMTGATVEILELGGAKKVAHRVLSGGGDGDDFMESEVEWK